MEKGEIVAPHSRPSTPSNPDSKVSKGQMAQECDTQERLCTPLRIMKPSLAEVAIKVMASLDKEEAENDFSPTPTQANVMDE